MKYPVQRAWLLMAVTLMLCVLAAMALRARAQVAPSLEGQVVIPDSARMAPNFSLRDQNGRITTLHSLRGQVAVITFLDSHCTQECPVVGGELAAVQQQVRSSLPWTLLVVSVAPTTDTSASMRAFARKSRWRNGWRWLLGTPAQLAQVWRAYGVWVHPTPTDILHSAVVYVIGPDGAVRVADMVPFLPRQMVQSIRALDPQRSNWLAQLFGH